MHSSRFNQPPTHRGRSPSFAAYLQTLPQEERRQIESAERSFVSRRSLDTSTELAAQRAFFASLRGTADNTPGSA